MTRHSKLLEQVCAFDDPSVDVAMAAAMPTAGQADQHRLAGRLLERGCSAGLVGLIVHFHELAGDVRKTVVGQVGELYRPMREAAQKRNTPGPANVIDIVARSHATALAYLVGDQLVHGLAELRRRAATCMLELARWSSTEGSTGVNRGCDGHAAAYLLAAIERAVMRYASHEQADLLIAMAAMMPRPLPKALAAVGEHGSPAWEALGPMVAAGELPEICRAMIVLGPIDSLRPQLATGFAAAVQSDRLVDVLCFAHLLTDPRTSKAFESFAADPQLLPSSAAAARLPAARQRALVWWVGSLLSKPHERVDRLGHLASQAPDPVARLCVLRRLMAISQHEDAFGVCEAIERFCFDDRPQVASIALRHLIRIGWRGLGKLLVKLVQQGGPQIAELAAAAMGPMGFERLWQGWGGLSDQQRLSAGAGLIKLDAQFHHKLGMRLGHGDRPARLRALAMVFELNQGHAFEQALIELLDSDDMKVAASAARALGSARSADSVAALERALHHNDPRVRANAVEALREAQALEHGHKLVEMARQEDNRPRANAIAALLDIKTGEAMAALKQMLHDTRHEHRISALWLADSAGLTEVITSIVELSITDPELQVRERAERVVAHMLDAMRGDGVRSLRARGGARDLAGVGFDQARAPGGEPAGAGFRTPVASGGTGGAGAPAVLAWAAVLAADTNTQWGLTDIAKHWAGRGGQHVVSLPWVIVGLGGLTGVVTAIWGWGRIQSLRRQPGGMLIYLRLALSLGMTFGQTTLLIRIARDQKLPSPLTLLLASDTLAHHGRKFAATRPAKARPSVRQRLAQIGRLLFEEEGERG